MANIATSFPRSRFSAREGTGELDAADTWRCHEATLYCGKAFAKAGQGQPSANAKAIGPRHVGRCKSIGADSVIGSIRSRPGGYNDAAPQECDPAQASRRGIRFRGSIALSAKVQIS